VPGLVGLALAKARTKVVGAHCRVGKLTKKASSAKKKGKVIGQSPKAGKRLQNGARVSLTIGKGPMRRK